MSVFRTIRKIKDCEACYGTGMKGNERCPNCGGEGRIEYMSRVNQAAAVRAEQAIKNLPPRQRADARERLQDQEPAPFIDEDETPTKPEKKSKVGKDFIEEG